MSAKQPVLIMIQGPEPGSLHKLPDNRVTSIGRSSRNTIRLVSPGASRFHCEVSWVNGRWELSDLNSRQGTIVNGERIAHRCVLTPGDIIRVGSAVFRFDAIDETAMQDGAMVAIMEAELDQRLLTKGEASVSLEDIRARSRLESEQTKQERGYGPRAFRANVVFVGAVAVSVAVIVTAVLVYAGKGAGVPRDESGGRERLARSLCDEGSAALSKGRRAEALEKLWNVERDFADTKAAQEAAQARLGALWAEAQEKLALATRCEADNDYAAALRIYDELGRLHPDRLLEELLEQRRQYTVRLAHASFKTLEAAAEQHAAAGDARGALELYRRAKDTIGVPELAAKAAARATELERAPQAR